MGKWFGFDLDGTLAVDTPNRLNDTIIGKPIIPIVNIAKKLIAEGKEVRLFTARAYKGNRTNAEHEEVLYALKKWCVEYIGKEIPITCCKDHDIVHIYDDKAIAVRYNTGEIIK